MITSTDFDELQGVMKVLKAVPYDVTRRTLYTAADLYEGYDPEVPGSFATCFDSRVYAHFIATGKRPPVVEESLARTLHDHGMHLALDAFFATHDKRRCVGVMGGHSLLRTDPAFRQTVLLSKRLTELGFCMLTGGGPGAMEATHLGAWMAGRSAQELEQALSVLAAAPKFSDHGWLATALGVMRQYPQQRYHSLGIPTWLYGHEPSTPFATHIAKFFENSIREDCILTQAFGGIIYTPGSAGTLQEVFQDAVQNHYLTFGFSSPMVFLGKDFWTSEVPVYPLLQELSARGRYRNLRLTLAADAPTTEAALLAFQQQ